MSISSTNLPPIITEMAPAKVKGYRNQKGGVPLRGKRREIILSLLEEAFSKGATRKAAASFAGIHYCTFYKLLKDPALKERFEIAEMDFRRRVEVKFGDDALHGDWQPSLKWLERRAKDDWGLEINWKQVPTETLIELLNPQGDLQRPLLNDPDTIDGVFAEEGSE